MHKEVKANFSGFDGQPMLDKDKLYAILNDTIGYSNSAGGADIAVMVSTGSAVIGTLAGVVSGIKASKQNQEAIDNQKELDDAQLELMTEAQKKEFELMEKKVNAETTPEQQVWSNPDLSQTEKIEAVAQIREALGDTSGGGEEKKGGVPIWVWAVGGIVVLGGVMMMMRKK